jgi:uncharacterized protein (TIGR00251 family)
VILQLYVRPSSREFRIQNEDNGLVVFCHEAPVKGKVNKELIKEFARLFHKRVQIVAGATSRQKRLLIVGASASEIIRALSNNV